MYADDYSTRNIQVADLVNGQIRRSARCWKASTGDAAPANALSSFINLMENGNIAHSTLNKTDVNRNEVVSSVVFYDEELAPTILHPCSVYTADVTFCLTNASCGFAKWFFLSNLLPGNISA